MKVVRLSTINNVLRRIGLVLVIEIPTEDDPTCPTRFWIETWRGYKRRTCPGGAS